MRIAAVWSLGLLFTCGIARADEPVPTAAGSASSPTEQAEPKPEGAAQAEADGAAELAAFEAALQYKTGDVTLKDGLATLHLGSELKYLSPEDTAKVLEAWGNPPGNETLGMLLPSQSSPFDEGSWAVVIQYSEDGHVDDEDAKDLDFKDLLEDMKKDTEEANAERSKAGFGTVHLLGWAEPPHYDAQSHKLYWAKELDFGNPKHTLNYDIRVLGRKGVLELAAVASIDQLAVIKQEMPKVLKSVEFNAGKRYADFDPGVDKVAAFGIGALVAGKVAAKAGLFKVIVAGLLASKKLIVAGGAAIVVAIKKLLGKSDETA